MRLPIRLSWMFVLAVAVAGCGPSTPDVPQATTTDFGRFEGDVVAVWDTAGRNMTLREDFAYVDSMGVNSYIVEDNPEPTAIERFSRDALQRRPSRGRPDQTSRIEPKGPAKPVVRETPSRSELPELVASTARISRDGNVLEMVSGFASPNMVDVNTSTYRPPKTIGPNGQGPGN